MSVCTFFGHSDCYQLNEAVLRRTIEDLIAQGVDTFYVGNHGYFDSAVFSCLMKLKDIYIRTSPLQWCLRIFLCRNQIVTFIMDTACTRR